MKENYIKKILRAKVYDVASETPTEKARFLSERLGNNVMIKREDLQPIFSFKIRGAYNKMAQLNDDEKKRGVIAASAGNHAQGVALAAEKLHIKAIIVMPITTPQIKVVSVKKRNAKVILFGDTFDEAYHHALQLAEEKNYILIHPYNDPDVIAGQGTIGMEILRCSFCVPDIIFVPVGGGGLLAGIAVYIKYLNPSIKIIGVEDEDSACLKAALESGRRTKLPSVGIFADGVAVNQIGEETFRLIKGNVDGVITVTTDEICAAIKDLYDDTRAIAEPAGALSLAGLKKYVMEKNIHGQTLLAINSGANINFDRLRYISERTQIGEKREAIYAVEIPEKPGSFRKFCKALQKSNITEFNYRYADPAFAHVFVGIELRGEVDSRRQIVQELEQKNYKVIDLSDDEVAKAHIRHMVGGRASGIENEHLFSFEFPERPGALLKFLNGLGKSWNLTVFHYRNHGAAYGRVLAGLQFDPQEKRHVLQLLDSLGYPYRDESSNPAYTLFLS